MRHRVPHFGIVGTGPAGITLAKGLIKHFGRSTQIHFYDKFYHPGGLLRYGVAPDHPETRHLIEEFYDLLSSRPQHWTRLFNGVTVVNCPSSRVMHRDLGTSFFPSPGTSVSLESLRHFYDAVVLATGCEVPSRLGLPQSHLNGIITGNHFVQWCNGLSSAGGELRTPYLMDRFLQHMTLVHGVTQQCHPSTPRDPHVVIIGFGNVALDVARLLLKRPLPVLPPHVHPILSLMNANRVTVVGRKTLDMARFSPTQIREILCLPSVRISRSPESLSTKSVAVGDFWGMNTTLGASCGLCITDVPGVTKNVTAVEGGPCFTGGIVQEIPPLAHPNTLHFMTDLMPLQYRASDKNPSWVSGVELKGLRDSRVVCLDADLVVECVGYQRDCWFESPQWTSSTALQRLAERPTHRETQPLAPLYRTGWCRTGGRGAIPETLLDAMGTAERLWRDLGPHME